MNNMKEQELIDKLEQAIQQNVDVCGMDAFVGIPALINTCRDQDRIMVKHADYGPDPTFPDRYLPVSGAQDVVYWKTGDVRGQPQIIGIAWNEEQKPAIFRAVVYPP